VDAKANDKTNAAGVGSPLAIAAIVVVAVSLRPGIVSIGPILPSLIHEFGMSHTTASLLTSIPTILMGLIALPTPWLARRYGRDPVLLLALLLIGVATLLRAFSFDVSELLLFTAGVGIGIAIAGTLIAGFIKARFPNQAAQLMGIYAASLSLGATISAAGTGPVENFMGGWRVAAGIWCIVSIVAIIGWLGVTISERVYHSIVPAAAQPREPMPLRNWHAWRIAVYFACINFLFYALVAWLSPLYREAGLSATDAGIVFASFTAAFMLVNPIFGWLSKSEDRRYWLAACGALTLSGLVSIAISPSFLPLVFVSLCAIGLGGAFPLAMTLPLDSTRSVEEANVWNAFIMMVGYLVAAAGPLLVGYLRDVEGDFHVATWLLVGVAALMVFLAPFLLPDHLRRKSDRTRRDSATV
jgi:CP family cyanate transporter-like MFS transporter